MSLPYLHPSMAPHCPIKLRLFNTAYKALDGLALACLPQQSSPYFSSMLLPDNGLFRPPGKCHDLHCKSLYMMLPVPLVEDKFICSVSIQAFLSSEKRALKAQFAVFSSRAISFSNSLHLLSPCLLLFQTKLCRHRVCHTHHFI